MAAAQNETPAQTETFRVSGAMLEVLVGQPPTSFFVHEALLRKAAPFFDNAMRNDWKEARERKIEMKVDDPQVFDVYMQWLYRPGVIVVPPAEDNIQMGKLYELLARAFTFGEKVRDNSFKDAVIDAIYVGTNKIIPVTKCNYPGPKPVTEIYENTLPSNPGRKFLVDLYANPGPNKWFDPTNSGAFRAGYPPDFLYDLVDALYKKRNDERKCLDTCKYHSHGEDSNGCYKQKKLE